jgi:hypothetical protein
MNLFQGSIISQFSVWLSGWFNANLPDVDEHWCDVFTKIYKSIVKWVQNFLWNVLKSLLSVFGIEIMYSLEQLQTLFISLVLHFLFIDSLFLFL